MLLEEAENIVGIKFWEMEWKSLGEIYEVKDGTHNSPKKAQEGKLLITSKNIKNGSINYEGSYFISEEDFKKINIRSKVDKNDILFTMIGTVGEIAHIQENPDFAIKNVGLIKINSYIEARYIFYFLQLEKIKKDINSIKNKGTQQFLSLGNLRKIKIMIPPMIIQKYVVSILDPFHKIVNDLKEGLPREIELRQKQYEYYRDKLFNFKEI